MAQLICNYDINKFDFSFTMNNSINSNPITKFFVNNGIYCCSQCPKDISFLLDFFPIEIIHDTFISFVNFRVLPNFPKVQIIELIVKNHFPNGINTYSSVDMKNLNELFCSYSCKKNISRKELSKYLRNSKEIICIDRGKYAHINQTQQMYYFNKNLVIDMVNNLSKLLIEKTAITGHEAFFTLRPYCKKLKIENQYALYGFIKWINPQNISCVQNQIGQISYTKT